MPVVAAAAGAGAEDELVRLLVRGGEPAFAEKLADRGGEDDVAFAAGGLEWAVDAVAGELAVDSG